MPWRINRALLLLWTLLLIAGAALLACSQRELNNPFAPGAGEAPLTLRLSPERQSVSLEWQWRGEPLQDIRGFRVYRAEQSPDSFQILAELPPDQFSYRDEDLEQNRWYFYRVTVLGPASETPPTPVQRTLLGPVDIWILTNLGFAFYHSSYDLLHFKQTYYTQLPPVDWAPRFSDSLIWLCHNRLQKTASRFSLSLGSEDRILPLQLQNPVQIELSPQGETVFLLDNGSDRLLIIQQDSVTQQIPLPADLYRKMLLDPTQHYLMILGEAYLLKAPLSAPQEFLQFSLPANFYGVDLVRAGNVLYLLMVNLTDQSARIVPRADQSNFSAGLSLPGIYGRLAVDPIAQVYYVSQRLTQGGEIVAKLSFQGNRLWERQGFTEIVQLEIIRQNQFLVVVDRLQDSVFLMDPEGNILSATSQLYDPVQVAFSP